MILEMRRGEMTGIVDPQTFSVRLHNVTGEAEPRALRVVHLRRKTHPYAEQRKREEADEGGDFPGRGRRGLWSNDEDGNQRDGERDQ